MNNYSSSKQARANFATLFSERRREFTSAFTDDDISKDEDYSKESEDKEVSPRENYVGFFSSILGCDTEDLEAVAFDKEFHEIRGLSLFNRYLRDYECTFADTGRDGIGSALDQYGELIQYLTLCIFFASALSNSNLKDGNHGFLLAIKSLVDGDFDGDRMDYTLRDGHEAGSDIGKFDLTRIVSNTMLISYNKGRRRYSFGYYIRALSGIEQFYEQRYQSYKYIIYHRTASRTNACLERLIGQLLHYSFLCPGSKLAKALNGFGYIEIKDSNIISLLPDTDRNVFKIDDANLRTLFIEVFNLIELGQLNEDGSHDEEIKLALDLIRHDILNLINIVAFRNYSHIIDPLKKMSAFEYMKSEIKDNYSDHEVKYIVRKLIRSSSERLVEIQNLLNENSNSGGIPAVSVFSTMFRPKIFDHKENAKKSFECQLAVVRENGEAVPASQLSTSLRSMVSRKEAESYAKFFIVSKDIKFDKNSHVNIMKIINEYLSEFIAEEINLLRKNKKNV